MHPVLFSIGSVTLYTHGFLSVLGIILGIAIIYYLAGIRKLDRAFTIDNIIYAVLAGIVGARILFYILYADQFASFNEIFFLWNGGMVSYGGFVLGAITFSLLLKAQKKPVLQWLDISAIGFGLGLFLGRIGNLMAGEYSGKISSNIIAIDGVVPVTLLEGLWVLVIVSLLIFLSQKWKKRKGGELFYLFLLFYGLGRFVIDFWRAEQVIFLKVTLGQWFSLLLAVFAGVLFYLITKKNKERNGTIS